RVRVEQRARAVACGPVVVDRAVLAQAEAQRHDVAEVVVDVDAGIEEVVIEVGDGLGTLVLVALELQVQLPRHAAERVREIAVYSRRLVRESLAQILDYGLA